MPRYFSEKHDKFMEDFIKTENQKVVNSTRVIFPLHRRGFIKACSLHLKIVSSVSKGITLVGVLSEAKKEVFREVNQGLKPESYWDDDRHDRQREEVKQDQEVHYIQLNLATGVIIMSLGHVKPVLGSRQDFLRRIT